ncbi:MAG TPA: hypothetical protein VHP14_26025 [Anaerolineales bacterium]|nr:hypothetical protein [Anaerolineales bacterium]
MRASVSPSFGTAGESSLKKELRLFRELFERLRDALLNRMFDLRPQSAARRMRYLVLLFFVAAFFISLLYYPLRGVNGWIERIQAVFSYLLNPDFEYTGNPVMNLLAYAAQVFVDPRIVQYIPIFLASFFIALQCAAFYLADVFELEDISVARRFIWAVALSGSEEGFRVTQGEVAEEYRSSPAYLIGGPGKVTIDLDSAALFEKTGWHSACHWTYTIRQSHIGGLRALPAGNRSARPAWRSAGQESQSGRHRDDGNRRQADVQYLPRRRQTVCR